MTENQLPVELQNDFEIVGKWPAKFEVAGLEVKHIEWKTMTKKFAEQLVKMEWKGIKAKAAAVAAPDPVVPADNTEITPEVTTEVVPEEITEEVNTEEVNKDTVVIENQTEPVKKQKNKP